MRGPRPDGPTAQALAFHWSVIRIGEQTPAALAPWRISNKEFREDLTWAVVVGAASEYSDAVRQLLKELSARGIAIECVPRVC